MSLLLSLSLSMSLSLCFRRCLCVRVSSSLNPNAELAQIFIAFQLKRMLLLSLTSFVFVLGLFLLLLSQCSSKRVYSVWPPGCPSAVPAPRALPENHSLKTTAFCCSLKLFLSSALSHVFKFSSGRDFQLECKLTVHGLKFHLAACSAWFLFLFYFVFFYFLVFSCTCSSC